MVAAALMWSSNAVFARAPLFDDWPHAERGPLLAFWRAAFAALVLLPTVRRPRFRPGLVPMALCFAGMNLTFLTAMTLTTPANAIWLQAAAPWWVCMISFVLLGQPVVRRDLIPLVFGLLGVGTILGFELFHSPSHNAAGLVCAVVSGITYAGVVVSMGRLQKENSAWLIALNHAVAAAVLLPWMFYLGRWPSAGQFVVLLAFGGLQMGVPYVLLARGLRAISAQEVVAIGLIEPVLVPVWVYLVWGIKASWWTAVGASLILTGLVLRYVVIDWLAGRGAATRS